MLQEANPQLITQPNIEKIIAYQDPVIALDAFWKIFLLTGRSLTQQNIDFMEVTGWWSRLEPLFDKNFSAEAGFFDKMIISRLTVTPEQFSIISLHPNPKLAASALHEFKSPGFLNGRLIGQYVNRILQQENPREVIALIKRKKKEVDLRVDKKNRNFWYVDSREGAAFLEGLLGHPAELWKPAFVRIVVSTGFITSVLLQPSRGDFPSGREEDIEELVRRKNAGDANAERVIASSFSLVLYNGLRR